MCRFCGDTRHEFKPKRTEYERIVDQLKYMYNEETVMVARIPNRDSKEPALTIGAGVGTASGLIFVLLYFFPDLLTERQTNLVLVLAGFILPFITSYFTRGFVWSPKSVQDLLDKSIQDAKDKLPRNPSRIHGEKATGISFDDPPPSTKNLPHQ